jgi:FKBP-type peptidyl-prolyl cis-trans isomerase
MACLAGCARAAPPAADPAAAVAFLKKNAAAPGVHVTASGLQYKVITSGPASGPHPGPADEVKVNYEGKLLNGQVFDSSYARGEPAVMSVDHLIPAWTEALQLMRPGDVWMLYAPPALAYGDEGAGPIPPGSALIFKIELIAVQGKT